MDVGGLEGSEGVDGRELLVAYDGVGFGPEVWGAIWSGSGWALASPVPATSEGLSRWFEPKGVRGGVGMVDVDGEGAPDRVASLELWYGVESLEGARETGRETGSNAKLLILLWCKWEL